MLRAKQDLAGPKRAHGIMFHHFHDKKHVRGQGAISADQLGQVIDCYERDHNVLSAEEWMGRAIKDTLAEDDVCLTFDDTLLCQYEVALPVLEDYKRTAFWFVYSSVLVGEIEELEVYRKFRTVFFEEIGDFYGAFFLTLSRSEYHEGVESSLERFSPEEYLGDFSFYSAEDRRFRYVRDVALGVERYYSVMNLLMNEYNIDIDEFSSDLWMREHQIKNLRSRGHVIGLHSHSHPTALAALPTAGQEREFRLNFDILSRILDEKPQAMSHPCNSYNKETFSILDRLGIKIGFRSNMAQATSRLEFPREDHANIMKRIRA
ncbi:polysaccharide deacetylase family protein [Planctomycetota bacterium]